MTVRMLGSHGVKVRQSADAPVVGHSRFTWHVDPQEIRAHDWTIEPDLSNALPFIAAAIVTGGRMHVRDWPQESFQPATEVLEVLGAFGARVMRDSAGLIVEGPSENEGIRGIEVDLSAIVETANMAALPSSLARPARCGASAISGATRPTVLPL